MGGFGPLVPEPAIRETARVGGCKTWNGFLRVAAPPGAPRGPIRES